MPSYTNTYALPWSCFPETLKQDGDRWLEQLAGKDILDENDFRPLRPSSLATRSRQLHELPRPRSRAASIRHALVLSPTSFGRTLFAPR